MAKLTIFVDSTGDLDSNLRKEYKIDYIPMGISFEDKGERKDLIASLDWDQGYSPKALYDVVRSGAKISTSQISRKAVLDKFKAALDKGNDVLYIGCSSGLSKSIDIANIVADELKAEYPDRKIVCVDSLISGYAQGDMAIRARAMDKDGKSLDEIQAWLEANKLKFNQWATTENLTYLKRAGRVSATSAFFGNIFGIRPILISDKTGHNFAIKKEKGKLKALNAIVDEAIASAEDIENQVVYVAHADDEEDAKYVADLLTKKAKPKAIHFGIIGPIVGGSTGPGTVAIYVFGKEVTADSTAK